MEANYVEVCPTSGVNVREGRVMIGPCYRTVQISYKLNGVTPVSTTSPVDSRQFFVPRVNTFRPDGEFLEFFNRAGNFSKQIRTFPCSETLGVYGVDVFSWANQNVMITTDPVVPIAVTSEQGGSQTKRQMIFTGNASVDVTIGNADNGRDVTFVVDMLPEILAGRFGRPETIRNPDGAGFGNIVSQSGWDAYQQEHHVEIRGPFNSWSGASAYKMYPAGSWTFLNGVLIQGGLFTATVQFVGDAGSALEYKFYAVSPLRPVGWESGANRSVPLGPAYAAQVLPGVVFRN